MMDQSSVEDPAVLSIFEAIFSSVAEEMGVTLGRTAHSPNIKERRDYSCAVFDPSGRMVAQAAHIPVHLGAMPFAVQVAQPLAPFEPGDLVILNDPYLGGTHLPDITMVSPVFATRGYDAVLAGFVASRAHHADVGGKSPGSMPLASELYQEGLIIPPVKLVEAGRLNSAVHDLILRNVRTPQEREGDFAAQIAAHRVGERRFHEILDTYGIDETLERMSALLTYAERITRTTLQQLPTGVYSFTDYLDDDGTNDEPVEIALSLTLSDEGGLHCDFTGSSPERPGSINAVAAVTRSACYYVVRCLLEEDAPTNEGVFRPVTFTLPERSVVNAGPPHAVSAGNVETSQRITDVMLGALSKALPARIPAASAGTMNNIIIGGWDPYHRRHYTYYETVAGGAGASQEGVGLSAVQTHMTNTLNTPIESLEMHYPFRIRQYAVRRGSKGAGLHPGGDGVVRVWEFLAPGTVTIISERRRFAPWGLAGGRDAACGRNRLVRNSGAEIELPGKAEIQVSSGDRLIIETPGGGGWGAIPQALHVRQHWGPRISLLEWLLFSHCSSYATG